MTSGFGRLMQWGCSILLLLLSCTSLPAAHAAGASFVQRTLLQKTSTPRQPFTNTADSCNSDTCSSSKTCKTKGAPSNDAKGTACKQGYKLGSAVL